MFKKFFFLIFLLCGLNKFVWSEEDNLNHTNPSNQSKLKLQEKNADIEQKKLEFYSSMTPQQAKQFAVDLFHKIDIDEKNILNAYKQGDYKTINQYLMYDINDYITKPYSEVEDKFCLIKKYFPFNEEMFPYLLCDRALINFTTYTTSLLNKLQYPDDEYDDALVLKNRLNFEKAKYLCYMKITMDYEEASKD